MAMHPPEPATPELLAEMDREVGIARAGLLGYAAAEGLLRGLVAGDDGNPHRRFADMETAHRAAAVEDLLWVIGSAPHPDPTGQPDEVDPLYPVLLQLAELFDILIDQFSLVYGDAVALAGGIWPAWHAMAGCHGHDASPEDAIAALERMRAGVDALPALLAWADRLGDDDRAGVVARFGGWGDGPLAHESRHLARHALETWMPRGVEDPDLAARLVGEHDAGDPFERAVTDLLLSRICRNICRSPVPEALSVAFAPLLGA